VASFHGGAASVRGAKSAQAVGLAVKQAGICRVRKVEIVVMPRAKNYWLVKTEPDVYSIQDLAAEPNRTTCWDGVRNYQARNFMRDEMKLGDRVLVYHSSTDPAAVVGVAQIVRESYPDHTSWDKKNPHYDPQSTPENPRWFMVDIQLETIFADPLPLEKLRSIAALKDMELLRKGSRLSVQPVRKNEFDAILKLAK
jgi:predicted RNA-binding protein with PUA-like domain